MVTHSPQVAALGNQHYKVSKILESGRNITKIEKLDNNKEDFQKLQECYPEKKLHLRLRRLQKY